MNKQVFIEKMAVLINDHRKEYSVELVSPILAQAILEGNWGESSLAKKYHNHFGLKCGMYWKGRSVNFRTKEEYTVGTLTTIRDNFRAYDNDDDGVKGYFIFTNTTRYKGLKGIKDAKKYLEEIKRCGYATSSKYVVNNMRVIDTYNLKQYDNPNHAIYKGLKPIVSEYLPKYMGKGCSIINALKSLDFESSKVYRAKLAVKNGIVKEEKEFKGSAVQNTELLNLLKQGKLKGV